MYSSVDNRQWTFRLSSAARGSSIVVLLLVCSMSLFLAFELFNQIRFFGWPDVFWRSSLFWPLALWIFVMPTLSLWSVFGIHRTKLIINADGVCFITLWVCMKTPWENIETIGNARLGQTAFLLHEPATVEGVHWMARIWMSRGAIPLSPFGQWWGNGSLAVAIRHHAAHLMRHHRA